jgi:hypothetical protein
MNAMTTLPNKFTRGYVECALWSSTREDGTPLDRTHTFRDIAPETLARMASDCADFQRNNADALTESDLSDSRAGFCFWLNRNGHGSGFWDEGQDPVFRKLSDASKVWGTFDLYVGDDGKIHGS